jgi:hypothetical protein
MSTATTTEGAEFYALESLLDDDEQEFLHRVRDFMKNEVEPSVNQHWQRGSRHSSLAKAWCAVRMQESVGCARELLGGNGILLKHNAGRAIIRLSAFG